MHHRSKLWRPVDYLISELKVTSLTAQDREEALVNCVVAPYYLELAVFFGSAVCLDSFLYVLTILPLRFLLAIYDLLFSRRRLAISRKGDLVKGLIAIAALFGLLRLNPSRVYHGIRGQADVKLFVIYSMLEVADKFCCALGQDVLDCLTSLPTTLSTSRTIGFGLATFAHITIHSFVLMWELVSLNVAVNAYGNALLTLVLTSQFSEIKAVVLKKFDDETLFQLTCTDITQRFQFFIMLLVIAARNLIESFANGVPSVSVTSLMGPAGIVICSMVIVDWLKHAYIVKFNNINSKAAYARYRSNMVADYVERCQLSSHHLMMRLAGLPILPLAIVCLRMFARRLRSHLSCAFLIWLILLVAKALLGVVLMDRTRVLSEEKSELQEENHRKAK